MPIIKDLGNDLILRRATSEDIDELTAFNSMAHVYVGVTEPDAGIAAWTRDLMMGHHPTTSASDFLVVEDTRKRAIVSTTNLISQVWAYDGIPFKLGRPELVATLPGYRNKGLVRTQFDVLHQWSRERGEIAQAITGIRYYYRQFGYEMTLNMPARRIGYKMHITPLKPGEPEPYIVRDATQNDLPFISRLYDEARKRYFITVPRSEAQWLFEFNVVNPQSIIKRQFCIIETPQGKPVGALMHPTRLWSVALAVSLYELVPGVSWTAVNPSVLRYIGRRGAEYASRDKKEEFGAFIMELGDTHPVYEMMSTRLPRIAPTYPYYMRVPDLPAFINHVAPALEARLAASPYAGHTGELKFNLYRSAFKVILNEGRITAEHYTQAHQEDGDIFFPNHTFLHMLFGHLELEEIERVYADVWPSNDEARTLLKTLFPRKPSATYLIG